MLRIARNHCLDVLRRRLPEAQRLELDAEPDEGAPRELADPAAERGDEALERRQLAGALEAAVAALPQNYREVVHLFHVEHLSYKEIAATLDVPIGTVMTWLHRARARLKDGARRAGRGGHAMNTLAGHLTDAQAQRVVDGALLEAEAARGRAARGGVPRVPGRRRVVPRCSRPRSRTSRSRRSPTDFTAGVFARIDAHERAAARERRWALGILAGVASRPSPRSSRPARGAGRPRSRRWPDELGDAAPRGPHRRGFVPARRRRVPAADHPRRGRARDARSSSALARLMPAPEPRVEVA